jgi:mannose-1-phosphate guanylyltransferase/mannose-6-phosphate isomerase
LVDNETLFAKVCRLVSDENIFLKPLIVSNIDYRFYIRDELEKLNINPTAIILEPKQQNTCPAIAIANHFISKNLSEDTLVLILPSDHIIKNHAIFYDSLIKAQKFANQNYLTVFGICPTEPQTNYGYIEKLNDEGDIQSFVEKPNKQKAEEFFNSKNYFWNSGIFCFKAKAFLNELKKFKFNIFEQTELSLKNSCMLDEFIMLEQDNFLKCENISVDYAVMEHSKNIKLVELPLEMGWNDLGNFIELYKESKQDENKNSIIGNVVSENNKNCYLRSDKGLIIALGLDDIIVVQVNDITMVSKKSDVKNLKEIILKIKESEYSKYLSNPMVLRPWGSYEEICLGENFKVKYIIVKPNSAISLQYHNHRAEHWVIVKGRAKVTVENDIFNLDTLQSTYIPVACIHRIENLESENLEFIEVQTGSIIEESDIVRLDDNF